MPIIGIITNNVSMNYQENIILPIDYVASIYNSGGEPYLIPIIDDCDFIKLFIDKIDGLLIPCGKDIKFGTSSIDVLNDIDCKLNSFYKKVIRLAREKQILILGICQGQLILNLAYNGTNCDLVMLDEPVHKVKIKENSKLYELFGSSIDTNSWHHQAISKVGEELLADAWTKENVLEGIEGKEDNFVLGVQWYPEKMPKEMKLLFDRYINTYRKDLDKPNYKIIKMTRDYALEIITWEYDTPYSIYNLDNDPDALKELLDNDYYVLIENEELVGFYCVGEAAQVPLGNSSHVYDELDYIDIGVGLKPSLCGKGQGYIFMERGLIFFQSVLNSNKFRLTVFDFNKRAINLYHRCGFIIVNYFKSNNSHYFLVMTLER